MRSEYRACKFNPSGKNLGGRNQIEGQQRNHLLALINTQPTVNTRQGSQKQKQVNYYWFKWYHPKRGPMRFKDDEIKETYRRVQQVKHGYTDCHEPRTFHMKEALRRKNSARQNVEQNYHQNNVNSMMRNILLINSSSKRRIDQLTNSSRLERQGDTSVRSSRSGRHQWDDRSSHPLEAEWRSKRKNSRRNSRTNSGQKSNLSIGLRRATTHGQSLTHILNDQMSVNLSKLSHIIPMQGGGVAETFALDYTEALPQFQEVESGTQQYLSSLNTPKMMWPGNSKEYEINLIDQYDCERLPVPQQKDNVKVEVLRNKKSTSNQSLSNKSMQVRLDESVQNSSISKSFQVYDKHTNSYRNIIVPLVKQDEPTKQYRTVKKVIMQVVMDYKIFQRELIFQVGNCLMQKNTWLDEGRVMDVCRDISKNLYGIDQ